jgi:xylulokinase
MSEALVGLDVGTTAVKGIAIDREGSVLARSDSGYPLSTPRPGWAEQDPEDWWHATEAVLSRLRDEAGPPAGIGLSGQMHGLVALDHTDRVLRPAILWNDQRTAAECREIEDRVGSERLIALTGNRALPGFTAPKLLWLRAHEPDVYSRITSALLPKDYVRLRLCGERATDVSDASGTLLLDVARRRWSQDVLEALELDPAILPTALEGPEVSGHTAGGVPVAAGGGDQAAGALGVGVATPGPLSVALGTSGVVFAAFEEFVFDERGRVHAFCHAVPNAWHAMGVMLSAAGSLRWLRDSIAPGEGFSELLTGAEKWAPGCEGLTFLPYLAGERTPHADPDARGAFVGLSIRHDRAALVRSVLEGVAYGLRDSLDLVAGLGTGSGGDDQGAGVPETPAGVTAGVPAGVTSVGRVAGGGARSELWLSIIASVLELPLERVAVDEGAAFGAALLGGVSAGVWPDVVTAVEATVRVREVVEPVPEWVEAYRVGRERFRALYPALRGV